MAWSNEEISDFQSQNEKALAEINVTLQPDNDLGDEKVGVFCQGQLGDTMTAMGVLKYRREIFGDKQIVWFINHPNCDVLRFAPISEVRPWPWPGNGLPVDAGGDFYPILCDENNRLNLGLAKEYELTNDLCDGYFPAAWMLSPIQRHGIVYPNISKKIFNIPHEYEWHPYLSFSDEEEIWNQDWFDQFHEKKVILFETFAGSGQSRLDEEMISKTMDICKEHWPGCVFLFASHKFLKDSEKFPEGLFNETDIISLSHYSVRKCSLIAGECDLIISVSSGVTVSASCWGNRHVPIIQFTGSKVCSTQALALGHFELVTYDGRILAEAKEEYYEKLISLLKQYK